MGRILAIAINTFREAIRDRVLYGVVGLACGVLVLTLALAELSLDQQERVVSDVGLASISAFSVVVAVFLGSSLLYKEIERKTLYVILPKPIERWEFLVGKFAGIVLTAAVFIGIMGGIQCFTTALEAGADPGLVAGAVIVCLTGLAFGLRRTKDPSAVLGPFGLAMLASGAYAVSTTPILLEPLLAQLTLTLVEVAIVASVALLFSSFSTPFLTGALTLGVFLIGRSADSLIHMRGETLPVEVKKLLGGLAYVVPNHHLFYPGRGALLGEIAGYGSTVRYVAESSSYGILYATLALALASYIFSRRDFA